MISNFCALIAASRAWRENSQCGGTKLLRGTAFSSRRAPRSHKFLEQTYAALTHRRAGSNTCSSLSISAHGWSQRLDAEISAGAFFALAGRSRCDVQMPSAQLQAITSYARVQLLTVARAQNQEWSHLIFAGWNEGAWPPSAGAEFALGPKKFMLLIVAFKSSTSAPLAREARAKATRVFAKTIRFISDPASSARLRCGNSNALVESASESVTLTASLVQEDAPERFWNPSECFRRALPSKRGERRSPRRH